jgi:hypothetical protein
MYGRGLALRADGRRQTVLVPDATQGKLFEFDLDGTLVRTIACEHDGALLSDPGELTPLSVSNNPDAYIYWLASFALCTWNPTTSGYRRDSTI